MFRKTMIVFATAAAIIGGLSADAFARGGGGFGGAHMGGGFGGVHMGSGFGRAAGRGSLNVWGQRFARPSFFASGCPNYEGYSCYSPTL
jgi:hypothetical protein